MTEIDATSVTTAQVLYPIAMLALGALVKWWMSGTVRSIRAVADDVKTIVDRLGDHDRQLGVFEERTQQLRRDLTGIQHTIERRKP